MRWIALIALAIAISGSLVPIQAANQTVHAKPTAEPDNDQTYAHPVPPEPDAPTDADIGPVLKHFVRATETDDLALTQNEDNAAQATHEKIALDKHISVPKIHDVQNDSTYRNTSNQALDFEIKYLNWGATTLQQLRARQGHYFTITWVNDGPKADYNAVFEYRQVKSKEIVRTLEQKMPQVSGATRSYFAVVNKAYVAYGPVCSWRFTIRKGDTIVAEAKSFIW